MAQMNLFTKQKRTQRHRTDLCLLSRGRGRGWAGTVWGSGISRCKLIYTGWVNNEVLTYTIGNHTQYPLINQNGKEY